MFSSKTGNRVRPTVEALEGREVPSVFVTPMAVHAQSIRHCHTAPSQSHGHPGGVITVHVRPDDAAGMALAGSAASTLTESIAIIDSTTGMPGTFQTITPAGKVHVSRNGTMEIKINRCALKTALTALNADLTKVEQLEVKVSNGTTSEVGFLTILPLPQHIHHHHHPAHA